MNEGRLRKLKVVVNPGNGGAGFIIDALEPKLPFEFVKVNDGAFPNGVPNPMLKEKPRRDGGCGAPHRADVGLGWDDYDRLDEDDIVRFEDRYGRERTNT